MTTTVNSIIECIALGASKATIIHAICATGLKLVCSYSADKSMMNSYFTTKENIPNTVKGKFDEFNREDIEFMLRRGMIHFESTGYGYEESYRIS